MRGIKALVLGLALTLTGCGGNSLGSLGDILGSVGLPGGSTQQPQQQEQFEVQQVDTRSQVLHVRTAQGEAGAVRYDNQTQVVYQQQQYPVTALERGDIVVLQVQQVSQNDFYVSRVDVVQSVQDRSGG